MTNKLGYSLIHRKLSVLSRIAFVCQYRGGSMNNFKRVKNVNKGDLVWYYRSNVLFGPLLVVDSRMSGHGWHRHRKWIMYDASTGDIHQSAEKWLCVPKEEQ